MKIVVLTLIGLSYISLPFVVSAQTVHAGIPTAGKADAGAEYFRHYCAACHSVEPEHKLVGPSLYSEMKGPHQKTAKNVQDIIVQGNGQMPKFGSLLSEDELADLLAYIRTL